MRTDRSFSPANFSYEDLDAEAARILARCSAPARGRRVRPDEQPVADGAADDHCQVPVASPAAPGAASADFVLRIAEELDPEATRIATRCAGRKQDLRTLREKRQNAADAMHSRHDARFTTRAARHAFLDSFLARTDESLPASRRAALAEKALRRHFRRLARLSVQQRRNQRGHDR